MVKAADGITDIYGNMWKPFDFDSTKKYPIIAHVYPGPQTESVVSSFTPGGTPPAGMAPPLIPPPSRATARPPARRPLFLLRAARSRRRGRPPSGRAHLLAPVVRAELTGQRVPLDLDHLKGLIVSACQNLGAGEPGQ